MQNIIISITTSVYLPETKTQYIGSLNFDKWPSLFKALIHLQTLNFRLLTLNINILKSES